MSTALRDRALASARHACLAAILGLLVIPRSATAQIQQHLDLRVPMRDGIELSANLWLPDGAGPHPTVLVRTPYIKANERYPELGKQYAGRGYAFIVQDARGRGDSDGQFDFFFADGEDGYDTIEWIARQPWSNGRVGMVGGSYLATVQWLAVREGAPNLVCMIPQAPGGNYFDELPYIGGAWLMKWSLDWINGTSGRTAQGPVMGATDWELVYAHRPLITMDDAMGRDMPLYNDFLNHPTRDAYWDRILFKDEDFASIDLPILVFTGWFDADQPGTMRYWRGMRDHSPGSDKQHIIIGPWDHGQAISGGELSLGEFRFTPESVVDVQAVHLDFFDYCLAGRRSTPDLPRARVYLTGSNEWREFDEYPPAEMEPQSLYLSSGGAANSLAGDGRLSWNPPGEEPPDRYAYDPQNPVPSDIGGAAQGVDQRPIERRHDVLVYHERRARFSGGNHRCGRSGPPCRNRRPRHRLHRQAGRCPSGRSRPQARLVGRRCHSRPLPERFRSRGTADPGTGGRVPRQAWAYRAHISAGSPDPVGGLQQRLSFLCTQSEHRQSRGHGYGMARCPADGLPRRRRDPSRLVLPVMPRRVIP